LRQTTDPTNLLYLNFEDDRISPLQLSHLDQLIEGYYELYPDKRKEKVYLFFDEIQNIPGWEKFVRRLYDTLNVGLFITTTVNRRLTSVAGCKTAGSSSMSPMRSAIRAPGKENSAAWMRPWIFSAASRPAC